MISSSNPVATREIATPHARSVALPLLQMNRSIVAEAASLRYSHYTAPSSWLICRSHICAARVPISQHLGKAASLSSLELAFLQSLLKASVE